MKGHSADADIGEPSMEAAGGCNEPEARQVSVHRWHRDSVLARIVFRALRAEYAELAVRIATLLQGTAWDVQFGDGQWVRGKSLDSFCPLGPVIVTADEICHRALTARLCKTRQRAR